MTTTILVTGGTGTLGRPLVQRLRRDGHTVRVLSRRARPDGVPESEWATGNLGKATGLSAAVRGVDTVVHCATGIDDVKATRNLLDALDDDPVHLIYISIVGIEQVPYFYYNAKRTAEDLMRESGHPWTILRATQFHDLVVRIVDWQRWSPVVLVPSQTRFQSIDVTDVTTRLAELAAGEPAGRVPDIGGPQARDLDELARLYLASTGRRRKVVPVYLPGKAGAGYRAGGNLCPENPYGTVTFEKYLSSRRAGR